MKTIELFCGAGLLGQGFSKAGFEVVFAADLDKDAVNSYNRNLSHKVAEVFDVSKVRKDIRCDVIIAGPPCQGFSTLGKRDKRDVRNKLSLVLVEWAKSTKAKVVVVENVPQFTKSSYFSYLVNNFTKLGYKNTSWVLNAKDYGTPQDRKRSFTIFSKIGTPQIPKKNKNVFTVKDAFRGLGVANGKRDSMHKAFSLSDIAMKRVQLIPRNGGKMELMKIKPRICPESWFALGAQASDVWGRMNLDKPSNTIRCCFWNPSKGRYLHPVENRVITLREGARLQGIPDRWKFEGTKSVIARQIGNGVPIPLATAVARSVVKLF